MSALSLRHQNLSLSSVGFSTNKWNELSFVHFSGPPVMQLHRANLPSRLEQIGRLTYRIRRWQTVWRINAKFIRQSKMLALDLNKNSAIYSHKQCHAANVKFHKHFPKKKMRFFFLVQYLVCKCIKIHKFIFIFLLNTKFVLQFNMLEILFWLSVLFFVFVFFYRLFNTDNRLTTCLFSIWYVLHNNFSSAMTNKPCKFSVQLPQNWSNNGAERTILCWTYTRPA